MHANYYRLKATQMSIFFILFRNFCDPLQFFEITRSLNIVNQNKDYQPIDVMLRAAGGGEGNFI